MLTKTGMQNFKYYAYPGESGTNVLLSHLNDKRSYTRSQSIGIVSFCGYGTGAEPPMLLCEETTQNFCQ
jgi:hypothetical protein